MAESLNGTELTCREIIDFVQAFLDGELPPRERTIFELHLKICPDCVNYLRSYETTQRLSKLAAEDELELKAVPSELVQAILAARKEA
jgi:anti-sigma factor RsiW